MLYFVLLYNIFIDFSSNVADVCRKYNFEKIKKVARKIKISDIISFGLSLVVNGKNE